MNQKPKTSKFQPLKSILGKFDDKKDKYISREWQAYGVNLAEELGDKTRVSLYIKLARDVDRFILERAKSFIKDANARSKPKLFMWKVGELKKTTKQKNKL
jgi:hypothetical protein